jgi:hypothetical protein
LRRSRRPIASVVDALSHDRRFNRGYCDPRVVPARSGRRGTAIPGFALVPLRVGVAVGLCLTAATSGFSAPERIGVSSAVNPDVTGTTIGPTYRVSGIFAGKQ